jgi:hypothetical protein
MVKFFLKSLLLICFLLIGILIGMEKASDEMNKMSITDELGAFNIQQNEKGKIEAEVLGENITSHNIKEKQEKLQAIKAFNFFSEIGGKLSELITKVFQAFIALLFSIIQKV